AGNLLFKLGNRLGTSNLATSIAMFGAKLAGKGDSIISKVASKASESEKVYKVFVVNWPDCICGGGGPPGANRFSTRGSGGVSNSFTSRGKPKLRLVAKDGKIIEGA
ncbi:hypothetical protein U2063_15240, partial [Listeria monocytogenes]|uniref:hypothetical protein n=1 Tax=Listeria monocytogenes TaxID=1639 RepID=UPI002FDC5F06